MNKKKLFLLTLVLLLSVVLAVGCGKYESQIDSEVHNCKVIIHANGGAMDDVEVRIFNMETGSRIPTPAEGAAVPVPAYANHTIVGYYRVELDENNNILSWGDPWDFQWDRVNGDVSIAVMWARKITYQFTKGTLVDGSALPEGFAFANPEEQLTQSVGAGNRIKLPNDSEAPKSTGYTLVGYYKDAACTQELKLPYYMTDADIADYDANVAINKNYSLPIYTKWIEGEFELIKEAADLTNIGAAKNYYVLASELDMKDKSVRFPNAYRGEFIGNGCVIKNLTVKVSQTKNNHEYSALFRNLEGAKISGITFENLVIDFVIEWDSTVVGQERNATASITVFSSGKDSTSIVTDVKINNAILKVSHKENVQDFDADNNPIWVANDYDCTVTFYSFDRTDASKIGTIANGDAVQEITFDYPATAA